MIQPSSVIDTRFYLGISAWELKQLARRIMVSKSGAVFRLGLVLNGCYFFSQIFSTHVGEIRGSISLESHLNHFS